MVEKAKKTPFKPLVKTQKQKEVEVVPEDIAVKLDDGFSPGLDVEVTQDHREPTNDNWLPWSVRLVSITSIGETIIALGDDRRLYTRVVYDKGTKSKWVAL